MSLLWKDRNKRKLFIIHKRPSPTYNNHILCFAQSNISHPEHDKLVFFGTGRFIEGISLFTSVKRKLEGSMTVEAAVVLPLFMFFFLNIGSAIEMIRLHGNLQLALWEVGSRMSVYGHVLDNGDGLKNADGEKLSAFSTDSDAWWMELGDVVLSYTYVKSQIVEYLGEDYLESSPLTYGVDGMQFIESEIREADGKFEMVLTYSVSPLSSMSGFQSFRMANRYYGHLWNGYHISGTDDSTMGEQHVYITENSGVYHTDRGCTHLTLSIRQVALSEAFESRNEQGAKYHACEKCAKSENSERVYITDEGDCYHFEGDCPGLKRTVYYVPVSEASDRRICERCAQ